MKDGIYTDISIEDYHENKTHISSTQIKYAKTSLKHFEWYCNGKLTKEQTSAMGFGNAFELALLSENSEYLQRVAIRPEQDWIDAANEAQIIETGKPFEKPRSSKIYTALSKEFDELNKGKYHIQETGPESFETIENMLTSCYQDSIIQNLIKNIEYQLSLFWTDPETGVKLKTRPDICKRKKNVIVNLKTTLDGSPQGFSKDANKFDYFLQACIEIRGCLATGVIDKLDKYYWLVVEKVAPYNATIYEFAELDIAAVMDNLDFLLMKIAKARQESKWPGYSDRADNQYGVLTAKIPMWYNF